MRMVALALSLRQLPLLSRLETVLRGWFGTAYEGIFHTSFSPQPAGQLLCKCSPARGPLPSPRSDSGKMSSCASARRMPPSNRTRMRCPPSVTAHHHHAFSATSHGRFPASTFHRQDDPNPRLVRLITVRRIAPHHVGELCYTRSRSWRSFDGRDLCRWSTAT